MVGQDLMWPRTIYYNVFGLSTMYTITVMQSFNLFEKGIGVKLELVSVGTHRNEM